MLRPSFIDHGNYRYFKLAGWLAALAILVYFLTSPPGGAPYGGTWFGYVLGISSVALVLMHVWYGVRKRLPSRAPERRRSSRRRQAGVGVSGSGNRRQLERRKTRAEDSWRYGGTLQGWLSAHVYLGLLLVLFATLHTGFRLGLNVHSLAYVLLLLIAASGLYGVFSYLHHPRLVTENLGEDTLDDILLKIAELDELARLRALGLPDAINELVFKARSETRVGGSMLQQLIGRQRNCPTDLAVQRIQELGRELVSGDQPRQVRDLYMVLLHKQRLVARARMEICLDARMQFWLYLHVPLSIALLAAIFSHVTSILVYW